MKRMVIFFLIAALGAEAAQAQEYPTRIVRLIVPSAGGGSLDVVARMFANFLTPRVKQPVVVENKPGAETLLGTQFVARAEPDGYTLLFSPSISSFSVSFKDPGVNVAADFEFISMIMRAPEIVAVNASRPYKSIAELAAYAKANPGKLNFASYGNTLRIVTEILNNAAGIKAEHVPYSNAPQAALAVATGEVDYFISTLSTLKPVVESGRVKMLAVTLKERSASFPDLPSLTDAGLKSDDLIVWFGLLAPKGTSPSIVKHLNAEVLAFARAPETVERFKAIGFEPYPTTPEDFRSFFVREEKLLLETGKALGIQPQ
jgi:tripartite-type tricarboxylate transporter receptor subunit TctC